MNNGRIFFVLAVLGMIDGVLSAEPADHMQQHIQQRDNLTNGFWGLNDALELLGIEFALSMTNIYQANVKGGMSTHRWQGRFSGSYDLEMNVDLSKFAGIDGGSIYMLSEGTWFRQDIDGTSVGSAFGVNGDFAPREAFNVVQLWHQQAVMDDTLQFRIGKLDMTGGFECRGCPVSFDGNMYANDENGQFLNSALVNNPTIPFPDYGLGAIIHWNPVENWYLSVGAADAQADKRETGFDTTFHTEDYFVYMAETGITPQLDSANGPMQGAYRLGVWFDPQPKAHSDALKTYRDDAGLYVSCDQLVAKENNSPYDTQGLGTFFRYGYAPSRTNDIANFYSAGLQYQGLFCGRDEDVLGLGFAHGSFSDSADSTYTNDYESVTELYYNARLTPWMNISPSVQYVSNPGGDKTISDTVVLGLRAVIVF
ncbi:MAG: carbohydrate porin [Planctomycetales bacterium]|nr:carbohydrate porin [Planctomycetales bacterium]